MGEILFFIFRPRNRCQKRVTSLFFLSFTQRIIKHEEIEWKKEKKKKQREKVMERRSGSCVNFSVESSAGKHVLLGNILFLLWRDEEMCAFEFCDNFRWKKLLSAFDFYDSFYKFEISKELKKLKIFQVIPKLFIS